MAKFMVLLLPLQGLCMKRRNWFLFGKQESGRIRLKSLFQKITKCSALRRKGLFASSPGFLTLGLRGISEAMTASVGRERGLRRKRLNDVPSLTHNPLLFSSFPPSLSPLSFLPLINFKGDLLVALGETSKVLETTKKTTTRF